MLTNNEFMLKKRPGHILKPTRVNRSSCGIVTPGHTVDQNRRILNQDQEHLGLTFRRHLGSDADGIARGKGIPQGHEECACE